MEAAAPTPMPEEPAATGAGNPKPEIRQPKEARNPKAEPDLPKTVPAREATAIAPGADPKKAFQTADNGMPDTQVDAGGFWSRAGLMPRGADGQTLPMPSLGYALPQSAEGTAAKEIEAAAAPVLEELRKVLAKKFEALIQEGFLKGLAEPQAKDAKNQ